MPACSAPGAAIAAVGRAYSDALVASDLTFDMLFGPAYKGIPLVTAAAAALAERHGLDLPFAFNRKESKDHGEGGMIVGGPLEGRVLIVDDVITAGTAIRESIEIIRAAGAHPAGVLLALDRQERGSISPLSAVQEVREQFGIPVIAVISLSDLMHHMRRPGTLRPSSPSMQSYRDRYGLTDLRNTPWKTRSPRLKMAAGLMGICCLKYLACDPLCVNALLVLGVVAASRQHPAARGARCTSGWTSRASPTTGTRFRRNTRPRNSDVVNEQGDRGASRLEAQKTPEQLAARRAEEGSMRSSARAATRIC